MYMYHCTRTCTCTSGNFAKHVICLPYLINMCNIFLLNMDYSNISCSTVLRVLYNPRSTCTVTELEICYCNLIFTCSILCATGPKRELCSAK